MRIAQKITPFLWFEKDSRKAAEVYTSLLAGSRITNTTVLHDTPSGDVETVSADIGDIGLTLMAAGPLFKFTPAISFLVACSTKDEVDTIWAKISSGGKVLMGLGSYPFSERYGWAEDRYGLSWQIMHMGERAITQRIIPTLMFVGAQCGKAEEALRYYGSVFPNTSVGEIIRYGENETPDKPGTIKHASFTLAGQEFAAMDSAYQHTFTFTEAVSFVVNCETQEEIDHYWNSLSAVPSAEQCGWCKDRFGVSWQVVPRILSTLLSDSDREKASRVTAAFLKMKKFDINGLLKAYGEK